MLFSDNCVTMLSLDFNASQSAESLQASASCKGESRTLGIKGAMADRRAWLVDIMP